MRQLCLVLATTPVATGDVSGARSVLERTLGTPRLSGIELNVLPASAEGDRYIYSASGGGLRVEATSTPALCRAVYDYLRSNQLGTVGWAGPRLTLPERWPDAVETKAATPFRIRHAYNAVTFGYTMPYWDWNRWEQELDWLALHGYNMAMAPVATEAIAIRVWRSMGLTDAEISEFYTGPAHLPWQRMGNIQSVGGGLSEAWHRDQIKLQKKLLARMRELGIEPVIQGFAGFVPKGMKRLHPEVAYHETLWNGGFPVSQRPVVMLPDTALWTEIMKRFIAEWKKEFGDARYWLVDSFNELQLPKTGEAPAELLARYGRATHAAIRSADPDGIWVLQGWMFNYQRNIWNKDTVKAFVESVPPDELFILDYANDYDPNWDDFAAFHGRSWAMGYVPNMGGKTAYVGRMNFYASQAAKTLASPNKGNLVGFTVSGEGLENNEVIYELMSDSAWSDKAVDLDSWLAAYARNRYGSDAPELVEAWKLLRDSVYSSFTPHPSFGWQQMGLGHGSVHRSPKFVEAVKTFLTNAGTLGGNANYRDDAVEMAGIALSLRAEDWFHLARQAKESDDMKTFRTAVDTGIDLLLKVDRLLESHSLHRLDRWLESTRHHDGGAEDLVAWERNARQIITVWGPPVNDYACRMWSGLIRDFYAPRMKAMTDAMAAEKAFDRHAWEATWLDRKGVSKVIPLEEPAVRAKEWVTEAWQRPLPVAGVDAANLLGSWSPADMATEWTTLEWPLTPEQFAEIRGVRFRFTAGNHRLDIRKVELLADGEVVAADAHHGSAGDQHVANTYRVAPPAGTRSNNSRMLRAEVRSAGGTNSAGKVLWNGADDSR